MPSPSGEVVKVRYGNYKVIGSVLASRLQWALGFGAARAYPVRVTCVGCSDEPWHKQKRHGPVSGTHLFDPATIERKAAGKEMHADTPGWSWPELDQVDERVGGAPLAQRDALKLLAVFMQHTDTKLEQQEFLCLPGGLSGPGRLREAVHVYT